MKLNQVLLLICIGMLAIGTSQAQVSINDTGTAPDASAGLDISADDKGLLIPRMTEVQRDNIPSPAHSLLIYQTDATIGYYYNAGTPVSPNWQPLGMTVLAGGDGRIKIDTLPFTITDPGSYCVAKNLTGQPDQNGITILASNVTINLNGFTLTGGGGTSGEAITVPDTVGHLKIMNGHITGWGDEGIRAQKAFSGEYLDLRISDNGGDGLHVGENSILKKCSATKNGSDGIEAERYSLVTWCSTRQNAGDGIDLGEGGVILGSSAAENNFNGFKVGDGCTVQDCSAMRNKADGFIISSGSNIANCVASKNDGHGFKWFNDAYIHDNMSDSNVKAGFHTTFADSRVEKNHSTDNGTFGFEIKGIGGCLVVRNTASGNALTDYSIGAGHAVGPVIGILDILTNNNPNANIKH